MIFRVTTTAATAVLAVTALLLGTAPALSAAAGSAGEPAARSGSKRLLLFAKNPATWNIIPDGAAGSLIYRAATGEFRLTAHGLRSVTPYAVIRYAGTPPRVELLARGTSDGQGRLSVAGIWQNWTRKFWLVSGGDVEGHVGSAGKMVAWRPENYLFEEKELGIPCACPEPEAP